MSLSYEQVEKAIQFNNQHALDIVPALQRLLAISPLSSPEQCTYEHNQEGEALVNKIAQLQADIGLKADGVFGRQSRVKLANRMLAYDANLLIPAATDEYQFWQNLLPHLGYQVSEQKPMLIALRGLALNADFTHPLSNSPSYLDTFIFLDVDKNVTRFKGSTLPYQHKTSAGADITEDGVAQDQVATIRDGLYHMKIKKSGYKGHPALVITTIEGNHEVPCWRDLNFDRGISPSEQDFSENLAADRRRQINHDGAYATGILLHPGFDNPKKAFFSIGCQTARLESVQFLVESLDSDGCDYLVLDAAKAINELEQIALGDGVF